MFNYIIPKVEQKVKSTNWFVNWLLTDGGSRKPNQLSAVFLGTFRNQQKK